jgi:hypothetical protein
MKKPALILLSFIFSQTLRAQNREDFIGKWKVVAVNSGVYYNYKNDSSFVSKKLSDSLIGKKDSAELIEAFSGYARNFENYDLTFDTLGIYKEYRNDKIVVEGIYQVNEAEKKINLIITRGKMKVTDSCDFIFEKKNLKLFIPNELVNSKLELILERL